MGFTIDSELKHAVPQMDEASIEAEFQCWMLARTVFIPPASRLPEKLQEELRGQYLEDREWHERPRS